MTPRAARRRAGHEQRCDAALRSSARVVVKQDADVPLAEQFEIHGTGAATDALDDRHVACEPRQRALQRP